MIKALLPFAIVLAAGPAIAAGTGPEIAYVKAGQQDEIYLVDPDGSRLRLLYRSPRKMRIFSLDMKPGGGELAFEETSCCTSTGPTSLKVIRYDDAGTVTGTASITTCRIGNIDYHPSGSDLLYTDTCGARRRLNTATMASTSITLLAGLNRVRWRNSAEFVYNRSTAEASEILTAPVADPTAATVIGTTDLASTIDVSTAGNQLLVDPVDFAHLNLFNLTDGTQVQKWQIGHRGRFSPNDDRVLYVTGYDVRGEYLMIRQSNGSGSAFRLAGKSVFGPIDWRN